MASRVEVLPDAQDELVRAYEWYWARSEAAADGFLRAFERVVVVLQEYPEAGEQWKRRGLPKEVRKFPFRRYPFVVFYVIEGHVKVVAIAHGRRRPGYWLNRLK